MKIIYLLLVIILTVLNPSYAQVKIVKEPKSTLQPVNKTGDGEVPIGDESKESSTVLSVLSDIASAYNLLEQSIELDFNKLIEQNKDRIHEINDLIKQMKGEIEKRESMQKKISEIEQITRQLEQEKQKDMQNIKEQNSKAILHANELIKQKSYGDLQLYSKTIKLQTAKGRQDSLQLIGQRYQVH